MSLSSIKQQENNLQREGDREREAGMGGSRGRREKRKFAPDFYWKKSCHTHSVVATCSFGDYSTTGC